MDLIITFSVRICLFVKSVIPVPKVQLSPCLSRVLSDLQPPWSFLQSPPSLTGRHKENESLFLVMHALHQVCFQLLLILLQ